MKSRCYPRYSYTIFFIIALVMFLFSIGPLVIKTNDKLIFKIIISGMMLLFSIIMTLGAIYYMQYYYIENNVLHVKSIFGVITKLDLSIVKAYIEILPTYSSWVKSIDEKWICLYSIECSKRFTNGCSNKKIWE